MRDLREVPLPANANTGQWAPGLSDLGYDVNGHITTLVDRTANGGAKTVNYRNDAYGQVLVREETQNGVIGPRQLYYYFNGMRVGDVGNNGDAQNRVDYAQQLAARGQARQTGLFRHGRPVASADFDQNYQPINAGYPGMAASAYTVRTGDTLRSIAQALWGDGAMWYLIADANGLSATSQLSAGQRLIIPNKVTNLHNNTGTFRVYDPGEAIGDTLPTLPNEPAPPPAHKKGGGCGGIGAILSFAISFAVSAILPGVGQAIGQVLGKVIGGVAGAAIGGAVGLGIQGGLISAVSQGINIAVGIQDKFSWNSVGMAALTAMVAPPTSGKIGGSELIGNVASGAARNALIQGLAVASGLQDRFDWAGVAGAGIGAGLSGAIRMQGKAGDTVRNVAQGLSMATAKSLIEGTNFGDNVVSVLPYVIGSTIGNIVAGAISKPSKFAYTREEGKTGNGTSGAGDGTLARPVAGVAGGRQVGASASSDAGGEEIVVIADRHQRDMLGSMQNYQWGWYFNQAGQRYDENTALQALALQQPASAAVGVTASFGPASSYDSPLIQSLRTMRSPLYDFAPPQQYMLGDGSVFTGTPAALGQFKQQRAAQANMAYVDRLTSSTIGGIALGVSHEMGASLATQNLFYDLGRSANDMLLSGAALRGGSIGPFTGQNSLNIVNGENGVHANSRLSGRTTWLYELSQRNPDGTQTFLKYGISVNPNTRYSTTFMKDKDIDRIASGTRSDMLALEREMVISNPGPLNKEPWAVKARGGR